MQSNAKREDPWPTRGVPGGFVDLCDSEAREAAYEARRHAGIREEQDAIIARIGREWRQEIEAERQNQRAA